MTSKDLQDGNSELEAGLLSDYQSGDDSPKQDVYAAPPPRQISPAKRRKTLACHAILIFLVFYIVGFMITSKSGLSFKSCADSDSLEGIIDGQDDESADTDMSANASEDLAQDLSPESPSDENLIPPTLVVIERRQDDGNSTITSSSSTPAESSTSPSSSPVESSTSEETSSASPPPTSSSSEAESTSAAPSSTTEEPESSTSSSPTPSATPTSTTQSEESSETSSTEESSESSEPATSSESSSSEEFTTSSEIRHTYTTTLPGGEATTIIATTWVGVSPSAQITSESDPDLQGSSSQLYNRADLALVLAAGVGFFMAA